MAKSSVLGPIILHDRTRDTETSSGQVLFYNTFDSRLQQSASTSSGWIDYDRVREIRRDATVQLARQAVVAPMIHTPWDYKCTKDVPANAVKFIKLNLEDKRDWFLQNAVYGALDFGWAPFEIIYRNQQGQVWLDEFKQLLQDYTTILVYIETGRFAGFANEPTLVGGFNNNVKILEPYAANFNLVVEGTDWYGQSVSAVLDDIVDCWDDVQKTANRYDRKMAGATWVVYYPVGTTVLAGVETPNNEIAQAVLTNLEASGMVAIPDEIQEWLDDSVDRELKGKWRVELITASGATQSSFIDRQRYLDTLKMRAFGLPERSILEGQFGTKAESETHGDIALSTVDTKHRLICDQLNAQVIRPLLRFNYGKKFEKSVWVEPAPLVDAQFQTVKEIYRLLVQSPQIITREIENIDVPSLRDQIGIPSAPDAPNDYSDMEPEQQPFGQTDDQMSGKDIEGDNT